MNGLSDLYWRLRRALGRGKGIVTDDTQSVQLVQLSPSSLETFDAMPRLAEYGFQSCPPDNWDGVAVFFSGDRASGVVIATGHQQYRVTGLAKGEVCISDNQGQKVYLSQGGIKVTDKAGSTVVMNGDGTGTLSFSGGLTINANTKVNGTLEATGNITADSDVTVSGMSVKSHVHSGVQTGGGTTGPMQG